MTLLPWHQSAWQRLWHDINRFPSALLIYGKPGIGKRQFAQALARAVLCKNRTQSFESCGHCTSCHWFDHHTHPDYLHIEPASTSDETASAKRHSDLILIDQIRQSDAFLYRTTHLGGQRVLLIDGADRFHINAANAFLKKLEEPPSHTCYILIADTRETILPTILSRLRALRLDCPDTETALQWLNAQHINNAAQWLARSAGAPLNALKFAQAEDSLSPIFFNALSHLPCNPIALSETLEQWLRQTKQPLRELVTTWQKICHDLIRVCQHLPPRYYPDYQSQLSTIRQTFSIQALLDYEQTLITCRQEAEHSLNTRLFLENMWLSSPFI